MLSSEGRGIRWMLQCVDRMAITYYSEKLSMFLVNRAEATLYEEMPTPEHIEEIKKKMMALNVLVNPVAFFYEPNLSTSVPQGWHPPKRPNIPKFEDTGGFPLHPEMTL